MIKSIQNNQKNISKDQNQKIGEIREILRRHSEREKKRRLRAFARTRAKKLFARNLGMQFRRAIYIRGGL